MKALNQAYKKQISTYKSPAEVQNLVRAYARENNSTFQEMEIFEQLVLAEFNKSRTQFTIQKVQGRTGDMWLNIFRQTKKNDGTFGEINKFSKKLFNVRLSEASLVAKQLADQIDDIVAKATSTTAVNAPVEE